HGDGNTHGPRGVAVVTVDHSIDECFPNSQTDTVGVFAACSTIYCRCDLGNRPVQKAQVRRNHSIEAECDLWHLEVAGGCRLLTLRPPKTRKWAGSGSLSGRRKRTHTAFVRLAAANFRAVLACDVACCEIRCHDCLPSRNVSNDCAAVVLEIPIRPRPQLACSRTSTTSRTADVSYVGTSRRATGVP